MTDSYGVTGLTVWIGGTHALDDVTLTLDRGAITAVVGGDGAGKTTLLRCLVGRVAADQGDVRAPDDRSIGYLPSTAGSWAELSVRENVAFVGAAFGLRGASLTARAQPLLERAGLAGVPDRLAGQLSGGMRKKLGFCLAILHEPALIVLDEPTTGVDPVSRVELWRMVAESAAAGATVVMATTYLDEAERAASLLALEGGRTLLAGTAKQAVGDMPGVVTASRSAPRPELAWPRGRQMHQWWPPGDEPVGNPVAVDLEDAVIVASLRAALDAAGDTDMERRGA